MKKLLWLLVLYFAIQANHACTTFLLNKNGQLAFGRNYDWLTGAGMVYNNLRGLAKTSLSPEGSSTSWVSKYGSVTFNQYGKEFPTGGMNEKGLVVELMWLSGSEYPKPDNRSSMMVLQWVQYQLDNCSTIEEVIATDAKVRISQTGNPPLHYLVADAKGNAATIEFLNGKTVVHKGSDLSIPVLTNTDYATSAKMAKEAQTNSSVKSEVFNDNSLSRFANACSMVNTFQQTDVKKPIVDYAFDILNKVSQRNFTVWSIVYDITNKAVYFKTSASPQVKSLSFNEVKFDCISPLLSFDMNQSFKGNISKQFVPFTKEANEKLVQKSALESRREVKISEEEIRRTVDYAAAIKCDK
jgi:choloylglycine hydrolase